MLKILIIDDDAIVLFVQEKMLQRCGFSKLFSFKEASKALKYLQDEPYEEEFLILLDINMPQMNGWDFLETLEKISPAKNCKIIMVTSSIDQYDKQKASNYKSVIGFIEKPITVENCQKIKNFPELQPYFTGS